jgi:hypothetical protein
MAGNSAFSVSATWLSKGWVWAFENGGAPLPPQTTIIKWKNGTDAVKLDTIYPPRWPRQSSGATSIRSQSHSSRQI